jgi:hypothetical protein
MDVPVNTKKDNKMSKMKTGRIKSIPFVKKSIFLAGDRI